MGNLTPQSGNLYLGAGIVKVDIYAGSPLAKTNIFADLGNVSEFSTTFSVDIAEKKTSRSGARGTYATAPKGVKCEGMLKLSEWAARNLAMNLLGTRSDINQGTATLTDAAIPGAPSVKKGDIVYIGKRGATLTAVKQGATTLDLGIDYTFDSESGEIKILETAVKGTWPGVITVTGTVPSITSATGRSVINPLQAPMILAQVRYKSATDQVSGPRYDIILPRVQIFPDGATEWLKDDFTDLSLKFNVLFDTTFVNSLGVAAPYGEVVELN